MEHITSKSNPPEQRSEKPFKYWHPSGVLHTEIIIDRMIEFLFAAQVAFGRLNGCVAEQELNLLELQSMKIYMSPTRRLCLGNWRN
jgi:hypothetical protein